MNEHDIQVLTNWMRTAGFSAIDQTECLALHKALFSATELSDEEFDRLDQYEARLFAARPGMAEALTCLVEWGLSNE